MVEAVLERKVVFGILDAEGAFSGDMFGQGGDVAAGAEGFFAGAGDDYYVG